MTDKPTQTILTDENTLTWAEVSTPQVKTVFIQKYGKYVQYRSMVPLDMLARFQATFLAREPKDFAAYAIAVLKYVMVAPALTEESARAAIHGDGGLLLQIMGDVVNEKTAQEVRDELPNF